MITVKDLDRQFEAFVQAMGGTTEAYVKGDDGIYRWVIGAYILSGAYGGYEVQMVHTDTGGVSCPFGQGHIPKRELYNKLSFAASALYVLKK